MGRNGDVGADRQHALILKLVENYANPVTYVGELMEDARLDFNSKPPVFDRLDELREKGEIETKKIGRTFAYWPAGKYENMEARIAELEADNRHLSERVDELKEELDGAREQLAQEREEEEREGTSPISSDRFLIPEFPTDLPDELELLYRVRATAWLRMVLRSALLTVVFTFGLFALVLFMAPIRGVFEWAPFLTSGALDLLFAVMGLVWLALGATFVVYTVGYLIAAFALSNPTAAREFDKLARFFEWFGSGTPDVTPNAPEK